MLPDETTLSSVCILHSSASECHCTRVHPFLSPDTAEKLASPDFILDFRWEDGLRPTRPSIRDMTRFDTGQRRQAALRTDEEDVCPACMSPGEGLCPDCVSRLQDGSTRREWMRVYQSNSAAVAMARTLLVLYQMNQRSEQS